MQFKAIHQAYFVCRKEIASELRTRYSISSVLLFILITIAIIMFAMEGASISNEIAASLLWIIMFFSGMTGLSKVFISEEERSTSLLLKLSTKASAVYFGKLLYNIFLCIILNSVAAVLFLLITVNVEVKSPNIFILMIVLGSIGIASGSTIISAIIAKASVKGALFPALAFPIVLPLLITGINVTRLSFIGASIYEAIKDFQLIAAYCGIIITSSYLLFEYVWED